MSFNRLRYDVGAYEHRLYESVGPGVYQVAVPRNDCGGACVSDDPRIRLTRPCDLSRIIDVSSELDGITRPATKCPADQYLPGRGVPAVDPSSCAARAGCARGAPGGCRAASARAGVGTRPLPPAAGAGGGGGHCFPTEEDTRLSNPPCTLRGTGINRFDPLCWNPQDKALEPWTRRGGTSYRIVVKDNHRPCLPSQEDVDRACGSDGWTGASAGMDGLPGAGPEAFMAGPALPNLTWQTRAAIAQL